MSDGESLCDRPGKSPVKSGCPLPNGSQVAWPNRNECFISSPFLNLYGTKPVLKKRISINCADARKDQQKKSMSQQGFCPHEFIKCEKHYEMEQKKKHFLSANGTRFSFGCRAVDSRMPEVGIYQASLGVRLD